MAICIFNSYHYGVKKIVFPIIKGDNEYTAKTEIKGYLKWLNSLELQEVEYDIEHDPSMLAGQDGCADVVYNNGADIDIEIKAKVIYESDKDNIINEYIVFCKVFNEQVKKHGMTKQAAIETIRICKDRNILKEYLSSKEAEMVTIMMSLFDDEQIMRTYAKDIKKETLMENAKHMLKMGKLTVEEIPVCYPDLTMDDAREIEEELMQFA